MAQFVYEGEVTAAVGQGPWIPVDAHSQYALPEGVQINGKSNTLLITLKPVSGSGFIEFTTAPLYKVYESPSELNEVAWPPGTVSAKTFYSIPAPTAFRVVCTSGSVQVYVRGI